MSPATIKTTRQMPIIILAFMTVFLLFLSEGEERHYASSQQRESRDSSPQGDIRGISGLGNIGRRRDRHRLILIFNVRVSRDFNVITVKALKDNQLGAGSNAGSIKDE